MIKFYKIETPTDTCFVADYNIKHCTTVEDTVELAHLTVCKRTEKVSSVWGSDIPSFVLPYLLVARGVGG